MKSTSLFLLALLISFGCSGRDEAPDGTKSGALSTINPSAGGSAGVGSSGAGGTTSAGGGAGDSSGQSGSQAGIGAAAGASGGSTVATSCETAPVQSLEPCSNCVPFEGVYVDLIKKCKIQGIVGCFSTAVGGSGEMPACLGVVQEDGLIGCLCRPTTMEAPPGSGLVDQIDALCFQQETLPTCE